jgi:RecB family exonuclease
MSASRLERRAACAYRSFLAEGLGLEAPDDPPDALFLDALTLGTLAHAALERLASLTGEKGLGVVTGPALRSVARAKVSEFFRELETDPPEPLLDAAESLLVARVEAVLARERDRKERLPLSGAEVRFGPKEPLSPRVSLASGEVFLAGQIDRLDREGDEALVVDYKFGASRPYGKRNAKDYRIAGGERLQLAVYALAARELGASRPRGEYLFVERDGDVSVPVPVAFGEDETKEAVDRFVAALGLLDEAASRGLFFPKTTPFASRASHCGNCDFDPVCGPGHARVTNRKREAERERDPGNPLFALEELR